MAVSVRAEAMWKPLHHQVILQACCASLYHILRSWAMFSSCVRNSSERCIACGILFWPLAFGVHSLDHKEGLGKVKAQATSEHHEVRVP